MDIPLVEDDTAEAALIEPSRLVRPVPMSPAVVVCFFREVVDRLADLPGSRVVVRLRSEMGEQPLLEVDWRGRRLVVLPSAVGAPLAVGLLEEVIALGGRTFVAVGGAGALRKDLVLGHPVVVESAVRDEGTSYHYLAASRTVEADPDGVRVVVEHARAAGLDPLVGRTWTTDAFYRETRSRIDRRTAEGCVTVEMEASAFLAVARYRGVRFAQLLYCGDTLAGEEWDGREWTRAADVREGLFAVAADAALEWSG